MAIWIIPYIFVAAIIVWICVAAIRKSSKFSSVLNGRDEIAEEIVEHPFTVNPIIWVIIIATLFISWIIFYYAGIGIAL